MTKWAGACEPVCGRPSACKHLFQTTLPLALIRTFEPIRNCENDKKLFKTTNENIVAVVESYFCLKNTKFTSFMHQILPLDSSDLNEAQFLTIFLPTFACIQLQFG